MILIDSNALIEILEKRSKVGEKLYASLLSSGEAIGTTSINLHEILYGLRKYSKPVNEILQIPTIEYSKEDAELSSQIELELETSGRKVRRTDTMIASIAINHSMKLLTLDTKHFGFLAEKTTLKLFEAR